MSGGYTSAAPAPLLLGLPGRRVITLVAYSPADLAAGRYRRDHEAQEWLCARMQPEAVSVDVGAHIGVMTLLLAQLAPRGWTVAVEPDREALRMLTENLIANGQHQGQPKAVNVSTLLAAFAAQTGAEMESSWRLGDHPGKAAGLALSHVWSIDALFLGSARCDLLRVDAAGWELEVLQGAQGVLLTQRPRLIIDVGKGRNGRSRRIEIAAYLSNLGYEHSELDGGMNWVAWPQELGE